MCVMSPFAAPLPDPDPHPVVCHVSFQIRIHIHTQLCAMCISDPDPDSAVCPMSVLCPDPDPVLCHVSCLHPAQRRLLLSVLAGVGLAAFAVIPTEKLSLKPSKPLYFYIVPLLRIQVGAGGAGGGGDALRWLGGRAHVLACLGTCACCCAGAAINLLISFEAVLVLLLI